MNAINLKQYVAKGTRLHTAVGWLVLVLAAPLIILVTILGTYGIALIFWVIAGLTYRLRFKRAYAQLRGSSLEITPQQFPEIYQTAAELSERMGLKEVPEIFIIEDNTQNAMAMKLASKNFVILLDDIVHGAECTGNKQALSFIIAHELAHHALGHTGTIRRFLSQYHKPLSRLDEFSCDAVAHAMVGDSTAARDALALLLVGPHLFSRVNLEALDRQAADAESDKNSKAAERNLSHPLLLRRYHRLVQPIT